MSDTTQSAATEVRTFGDFLKQHRISAHLTQEELAERANVSERTIRKLERGELHIPRAGTLHLLATALHLTPEQTAAFRTAARAIGERAIPSPSPGEPALPSPLTPLVGREPEVRSVGELLRRDDARLLTICGVGGVGKTRVALEVVRRLAGDFTDGVHAIWLAAVGDAGLVLAAIAAAVGARESGAAELPEVLRAHLQDRRLLLLLDNCEHVLAAAPLIANLLAVCPGVRVLATSRVILHVHGEQIFVLAPLALPVLDLGPALAVEAVAQVPSVALFTQCAQRAQPTFALTPGNVNAVAAICRRLEGLPLALELAAARIRLLPPAALLHRLESRLGMLTGGPADAPARQRTLRDTLAWSESLLSKGAQAVFRRLAVFAGGCTVEAAELVCAMGDQPVDVLEALAELVDHHLVAPVTPHDGAHEEHHEKTDDGGLSEGRDLCRLAMLETVREFAWERLRALDEAAATERAHAEVYLTLAEAAQLRGANQAWWLARLETEHDNLRAVLRWALMCGETTLGLRLAGALRLFWYKHGYLTEGRAWLERLLERDAGAAAAPVRALAYHGAGLLAYQQGDYVAAATLYRRSLALREELGDRPGVANLLNNLGILAAQENAWTKARDLYARSLTIKRELDDLLGIAQTLNGLGVVARLQGDIAQAVTFHAESLAIKRELGDTYGAALSLNNLAEATYQAGDLARAETLATESLALHRELGNTVEIGAALDTLAEIAVARGDEVRAAVLYAESLERQRGARNQWGIADELAHLGAYAYRHRQIAQGIEQYRQALALYQQLGLPQGIADALEGIARGLGVAERPEQATQLLGAATALRKKLGTPPAPAARPALAETETALRATLGSAAFTAAWEGGQALSPDEAITEAFRAVEALLK